MPTAPRTARKTTEDPAPADEETVGMVEDKAVPADTETKTPDVAPLEPPTEPDPLPEPAPLTTAQQLLPARLGDLIVDEATGHPPADPEGVFVTVQPYGSSVRCTVRLIEHVGMGAYNTPTTRLLVPAGAELRRDQAARIVARLRAQLTPSAE
ncbi:hypothetical protein ABZ352_18485 [Streptomyces griseofuscus]|uniref:hypothetical protein n=1 Tax=Streptomyces griseofuscus TaxID=146922 RepID=UPI0033EAFDAF